MINPDLSVGDEIVLVFMEGESGMPPGTKGVVTRITRDPFEDEGDIIEVTWENKRPLSLLSTTDLWMKPKDKINEQDEIEKEFSKLTSKISPFNTSATATCEAMKLALESYSIPFANVGKSGVIELPGVNDSVKFKTESQQRFVQWYSDVIKNPDSVTSRGKSFEGLIGGVFNGKVENFEGEADKTDVSAQGKNLSIKFSQNFNPEGTQNLGGVTRAIDAEIKIAGPIVKDLLSRSKISKATSVNLERIFLILLNQDYGKEFLLNALDSDNSFRPINYFMFANYDKLNEIKVYQYRKEDILKHLVNGNYGFNGGVIYVKNLKTLKSKILTIKFPQYTKTKRQKYGFETRFLKTNFSNEPTVAITIKDNEKIVGRVYRELKDGEPNYFVKTDKKISKDLEIEAINKAILKDIRAFDMLDDTDSLKFLKKLQNLSDLKSKELFVIKSRTSEKGREQGIKDLFGGRGENLNPYVIQNIRKNPERFFKKAFEIYGCDSSGVSKIEGAMKKVFDIDINLPIARYCTTNNVTEISLKVKNMVNESLSMDELHGLKGVFKNFNQKIIMNFFDKLRESGLVNMLESPRFTWSGREYLERFIDLQEMEGFEIDPDDKAELLDAAFEIQMELIRASMNVLEDEGKEDTIENINRVARKLGVDLLKYYMIIKK